MATFCTESAVPQETRAAMHVCAAEIGVRHPDAAPVIEEAEGEQHDQHHHDDHDDDVALAHESNGEVADKNARHIGLDEHGRKSAGKNRQARNVAADRP